MLYNNQPEKLEKFNKNSRISTSKEKFVKNSIDSNPNISTVNLKTNNLNTQRKKKQ